MTVREKLESMLCEHEMFAQQAQKVMDIAIPKINEFSGELEITWDSDWDAYEDEMYEFLYNMIKPEALAWINEHAPKAWYRENFID
jgi:uncharacterized iron-regulated protein